MAAPHPGSRLEALVADYLAAWNEEDPAVRRRLLQRCWDVRGVYADPGVRVEGRAALARRIAHVQSTRPGSRLELVGEIDQHHGLARFLWRQVRADGSTGPVSTDFVEVGPSGLLTAVTGFFGS